MTIITGAEGIKLINEYKCLRCHQLDGIGQRSRPRGGSVGPDLSAIASQRNWAELYAHLLKPDALVPGSTMPDFGLRRGEATAITAFLLTRLNPRDHVSDATYLTIEPVLITPTPAPREAPLKQSGRGSPVARGADRGGETAPDYDGRKLFEGLACSVCHRVRLTGGEVGPALSHVGRARDAAWLRNLLTDPARVFPNGQMPAYDLSEAQLMALVDYLTSLK